MRECAMLWYLRIGYLALFDQGGSFTLLHLQQKDEMTWMHQWWDFVRYPWVDLTGFMVLIIYISLLLVTYSFLEVMCNMYNLLALKMIYLLLYIYSFLMRRL